VDKVGMNQAGLKWTRLRQFVVGQILKTWARFKKGISGNGSSFI
jgi:hypothetical protein